LRRFKLLHREHNVRRFLHSRTACEANETVDGLEFRVLSFTVLCLLELCSLLMSFHLRRERGGLDWEHTHSRGLCPDYIPCPRFIDICCSVPISDTLSSMSKAATAVATAAASSATRESAAATKSKRLRNLTADTQESTGGSEKVEGETETSAAPAAKRGRKAPGASSVPAAAGTSVAAGAAVRTFSAAAGVDVSHADVSDTDSAAFDSEADPESRKEMYVETEPRHLGILKHRSCHIINDTGRTLFLLVLDNPNTLLIKKVAGDIHAGPDGGGVKGEFEFNNAVQVAQSTRLLTGEFERIKLSDNEKRYITVAFRDDAADSLFWLRCHNLEINRGKTYIFQPNDIQDPLGFLKRWFMDS
jgi:hypothetical protein